MPSFSNRWRKALSLPVLFLLLAFAPSRSVAQQNGPVLLRLADSVLEVRNEALQDVTIDVENTGSSTFTGVLHLYCGKGARIATKQDIPVTVAAGKHLFVPAKVYIGITTLAGNIPYAVSLYDQHNTKIADAGAKLYLPASKAVRASFTESDVLLPPAGTDLQIPVVVSNRGNVGQLVDIVIAYPSELQDRVNKSIKFEVPPFHDTTLYFTRRVNRTMTKLGSMNISLYGVYPNGDYFSISSATVQNIRSRKKFNNKAGSNNFASNSNYVSLGAQNTFSANESYFLQSKGDYALSKDMSVAYSLSVFRWKNATMPMLVNDTWLGIRYKGLGIKVGNIMQNGELSYNGRGAEMYYFLDSLQHYKIYAGYLDKSFNLFNNSGSSSSFGRAAWVGFQQQGNRFRNNTTISYDEDKYAFSKSVIVVNDASWHISELLFAGLKAGLANSSTLGASDTGQVSHPSYSLSGSVNGNITKALSLSSDNQYASGYYPGTRRGTFALNERLNLRLGKTTLSGGYMYTDLNPEYFRSTISGFRNHNRNSTVELSLAASLGGFGFSLAPQYYREEGNWYDGLHTLAGKMESGRLSASFSYAGVAARQNLMLRIDLGSYHTNFTNGQQWQLRGNLTYNYSFFRLSALVQKGNFYLSEAFQQYTGSGQGNFRINISPSLSYGLFNNKLRADAGITYYKDFFISSFLYNGSFNLYLNTTRIFATVQYNTFSSSVSYHNVQLGIMQLLPQSGRDNISNKGSLHIQVYYDLNGNSVYDSGDSLAMGYIASINKVLLLSDNNGRMVYSKLPAGSYRIYFPTQKGWYGQDQLVVLQDKQAETIQVPLRQTGTLSGSIRYEFNELLSYSTEKEIAGQAVIATDADGKTFESKTDDHGAYLLYLPTGTYTVTIGGLPEQIEVQQDGHQQPVAVHSGEVTAGINFVLKVKQRKIEVKKFGQH